MYSKHLLKYKADIHTKLMSARDAIEEVIGLIESKESWKQIHTQTEYAVRQLKRSTQLLAHYHLEVCIPSKLKQKRKRIPQNDMREIINTFNYTG